MAGNLLKNLDKRIQTSLHIITLLATNIWIFYGDRNLKSALNQICSILTFLSSFLSSIPANLRLGVPSLRCPTAHYPFCIISSFTIGCHVNGLWSLIIIYQAYHHLTTYLLTYALQSTFKTSLLHICISSLPRVREYLETVNCKLHQVHQAFFGDLRLKTRRAFGFGRMPLVKSIFLGRVVIPGG